MLLRISLAVACIFSSCAKKPHHVKVMDNISAQCHATLHTQHKLQPLASGCYYSQGYDALYFDYELAAYYTPEEAKELLLQCVEHCCEICNASEDYQKHANVYPVGPNEISLSIAFMNPQHKPYEELAQIHLYQGEIFYSHFDAANTLYVSYKKESYFQKVEE